MAKSVEGTAQRRKLLGEIERLAEIAGLGDAVGKMTAPADERVAMAAATDPERWTVFAGQSSRVEGHTPPSTIKPKAAEGGHARRRGCFGSKWSKCLHT